MAQIYACTSPDVKTGSAWGSFPILWKSYPVPWKITVTDEKAKDLWAMSESILKSKGFW